MTCVHFRPNLEVTSQVGAIGMSQTADACDLLVPSRKNHRQVRRALYDRGFMIPPTAFGCPAARDARWRDCPLFERRQPAG